MASSAQSDLDTLTNFCSPWFVSGVSCESVTSAGHSSSNLISEDAQMRRRGLQVEHYIRPPVTVLVDLCVPVSVFCVLLCPDLPEQAEMRVELSGRAGTAGGVAACRLLCPGPLTVRSGSLLVARNKQFRASSRTQEIALVPSLTNMVIQGSRVCSDLKQFVHSESALKNTSVLRHLRHLQLKVIKWTGPKPVSIKWLEIWGVVSKASSKQEMALFHTRLQASTHSPVVERCSSPPGIFSSALPSHPQPEQSPPPRPEEAGASSSSNNSLLAGVALKGLHSEDIPEQFLDELTFEVMVLPMLLPSGHFVDKSTLDRLAVRDANYGRSPTDPFTGIPFSELCKPEFCVKLKTRLDHYLSTSQGSSAATTSLSGGRTLGSAAEIERHMLKTAKCHTGPQSSLSPACKRARLGEEWVVDCSADRGIESGLPGPSSCDDGNDTTTTTQDRTPQQPISSFDAQVGDSLEQALNQLLHDR